MPIIFFPIQDHPVLQTMLQGTWTTKGHWSDSLMLHVVAQCLWGPSYPDPWELPFVNFLILTCFFLFLHYNLSVHWKIVFLIFVTEKVFLNCITYPGNYLTPHMTGPVHSDLLPELTLGRFSRLLTQVGTHTHWVKWREVFQLPIP